MHNSIPTLQARGSRADRVSPGVPDLEANAFPSVNKQYKLPSWGELGQGNQRQPSLPPCFMFVLLTHLGPDDNTEV